jgi:hypothetical protein
MFMQQDENTPDIAKIAQELSDWLEAPQEHLNSMTRKRAIEVMLIGFAERVRAKEARKAWGQGIMLWCSLGALSLTLGPKVISFLISISEATP